MNQTLKRRLSRRFRAKRDVALRDAIARAPRRGKVLEILDLGGRPAYWQRVGYDFLVAQNVHITIQNLAENELVNESDAPEGLFDYVIGDACSLDYENNAFGFCHSNSVIEHVGIWSRMRDFAGEVRRVAPSHYVQTPNYWFPVEPHFWTFPMIHWLPRPMRAGLTQKFPIAYNGKAKDVGEAYEFVDGARLITRKQMRFLFPESRHKTERLALLPKSLMAILVADTPKPQARA